MPEPAVKDASGLYEVERRAYHAARDNSRIFLLVSFIADLTRRCLRASCVDV